MNIFEDVERPAVHVCICKFIEKFLHNNYTGFIRIVFMYSLQNSIRNSQDIPSNIGFIICNCFPLEISEEILPGILFYPRKFSRCFTHNSSRDFLKKKLCRILSSFANSSVKFFSGITFRNSCYNSFRDFLRYSIKNYSGHFLRHFFSKIPPRIIPWHSQEIPLGNSEEILRGISHEVSPGFLADIA